MKPRVPFASSSVESLSREVGPDLSTAFPRPTASARWVFLGHHLPLRKDIKRVGSHSCRPASLSLTDGNAKGRKCSTLYPNAWMNCYTMQIPKLFKSVLSHLRQHLSGPASAAMPLTIPLLIFLRGPGCTGWTKLEHVAKGLGAATSWNLSYPLMNHITDWQLKGKHRLSFHLWSTGGFISHRIVD